MGYADLVLKSNCVFTGFSEAPFKGGVAVKGNKILDVGLEDAVDRYIGPDTKVYAYGDNLIMPGFVEAHIHFVMAAFFGTKYMIDLFDCSSEQECVARVVAYNEDNPDCERILGSNWWPQNWDERVDPHRANIDRFIDDKPVYMICSDYHTVWCNTKALEECGVTKETTPSFGRIGKDADGELTGVLYDMEACAPAFDNAFKLPDDILKNVLKDFFKRLASRGITSAAFVDIKTVSVGDYLDYRLLGEMEKDGDLTCRLHMYPSLGTKPDLSKQRKLRDLYTSEKLRVSGLKQFFDGATTAFTSYLLEPFTNNPSTRGMAFYPDEIYKEMIALAHKEGFDLKLHVIGDAATRLALDCLENAYTLYGKNGSRDCLEHIETPEYHDMRRFGQLDIIASMQPPHLPLNDNEKIVYLGKERAKCEFAYRSFQETGATLAFGTDCPVSNYEPMPSLHAAVARKTDAGVPTGSNPWEKLSLPSALKAYTYGGAYAVHREHEFGTLKKGFCADIAVIDGPLFGQDPETYFDRKVLLTVMDGKVVHEL
ncbi:MAG: amidohydrolase [Clostridiales Family XIII bacterium]|jgi:predicted amidohydrolase YtcJ|nr:amidohydrolase [Clostridiales Family XIII bacterium]